MTCYWFFISMTCFTRPWEYSYILIVQSITTDRENVVAYIIVQSMTCSIFSITIVQSMTCSSQIASLLRNPWHVLFLASLLRNP